MTKQRYDLEERLLEERMNIEHPTRYRRASTCPPPADRTLNGKKGTQRWLKLIQKVPLIKKPELLNNILEETEELIKIFVTSIKTASGP